MTYTNQILSNFSNGEASHRLLGRSDLPVFKSALSSVKNFIVLPQGPVYYRPGFKYMFHTRRHQRAFLDLFEFNESQAYILEFTHQMLRFHKEGGPVVLPSVAITGVTNASPGVVTAPSHGLSTGDEVILSGISGMPELANRSVVATVSGVNTFSLNDEFGDPLDTSAFGAYISGGVLEQVYEIPTPYDEAYLQNLQGAQNADTRYIVHRGFAPRKLVRSGETSWAINTFTRLNDPFGSNNWPGAVTFTSDARILYGGTATNPSTIYGSRSPTDAGAPRYDDFTTGTTAANAYIRTLAPLFGKVDYIRWLTNTNKFLVAGCLGSVRRIYGTREDTAITALDITAKSINSFGASASTPVANGVDMLYIDRSTRNLKSIEYNYQIDGYDTVNKNLISNHIGEAGLSQVVAQNGDPNIIWCVRDDGVLAGLTYDDKENKYGWHRHEVAGGRIENIQILPRLRTYDQLWSVAALEKNGKTYRRIQVLSDRVLIPRGRDFYTGRDNRVSDRDRYWNVLYETQKTINHLDSSVVYDGRVFGTDSSISITPGTGADTVGTTDVVFTASASVFTSSMVGRQIWKTYDSSGAGGGRLLITEYISATVVKGKVLVAFDGVTAVAPGSWALTADHISGIHHLEQEEVSLLVDGGNHSPRTVGNGQVTLSRQASHVIIGTGYRGEVETLPLDQGGVSGPAVSKRKNIARLALRVHGTSGISFGSDRYVLQNMTVAATSQTTDRPAPLVSGILQQSYDDGWSEDKSIIIIQEKPLPCEVLSFDIYAATRDE